MESYGGIKCQFVLWKVSIENVQVEKNIRVLAIIVIVTIKTVFLYKSIVQF